ncbi:sensor histidine kinase [Paenibacillus sp. WLX1005]|uniref:sensor histidine kinase n=1 Tax=Paenibacillus sp. WLX1005 TaxID=3243766 RepID=UPI003984130D
MHLKALRERVQMLFTRLNGVSLQSRLIVAYIVVILLPTAAISYYSYQQINTTYIQDTRLKSMDTLQNEKQTILTQIETMERAAQLALSDKAVVPYLTEDQDTPTAELLEFNTNSYARLAQIQINNPSILHLRLYSDSPNTYEIWPIILHEQRTAEAPWYSMVRGLGDREAWYMQRSDLSLDEVDTRRALEPDPPKLSLLRELELPRGHHAGIIQVDMRLSDLAPLTFGKSQEDSTRMLLLDAGGGHVSADEQDTLYTRLAHRLLNDPAGDAVETTGWSLSDQKDSDDLSSEQAAYNDDKERSLLSGQSSSPYTGDNAQSLLPTSAQYREDGQSYLLTSIPVERLGARLVQVTSLETMLQDTGRARNLIIMATVAFILLVSLITYVANALILKNLRKLTQAMQQMRRGEFPPVVQVDGGGEIGELAYHFNRMSSTINELIAQAVRKQALMKEAELRTLYSQIDAHFLYNTLENIKMLAEIQDQRQISDALTSLGGMMRYNFKWAGEYVTLEQELRHIRNYIDVMNIRFDEPVILDVQVAPLYNELELLKMSLQPIVENAFKHGWDEEMSRERLLTISVEDEDHIEDTDVTLPGTNRRVQGMDDSIEEAKPSHVLIRICDNGQGMSATALQQLNARLLQYDGHTEPSELASQTDSSSSVSIHQGVGLLNVQQRISLFFGEPYGLQVRSVEGAGTEVRLRIPKIILAGGDIRHETTTDRG